MAIWYILWLFGICFPVLVCCTKKNMATLPEGKPWLGALLNLVPKLKEVNLFEIQKGAFPPTYPSSVLSA
jgi:hypothetical protein